MQNHSFKFDLEYNDQPVMLFYNHWKISVMNQTEVVTCIVKITTTVIFFEENFNTVWKWNVYTKRLGTDIGNSFEEFLAV